MLKRLFGNHKPEEYSVLVLDDDPGLVHMIVDMLRSEGFVVHAATSGDEALKLLDQIPRPNVFVLDLKMPGITGDEFLERARIRYGKNAIPPVLLLTASKEGEAKADEMAANDFLPKPFNGEELVRRIWGLIEPGEA
jgi:CheY-like chemotaxis protein